jgi:hypothetical protein
MLFIYFLFSFQILTNPIGGNIRRMCGVASYWIYFMYCSDMKECHSYSFAPIATSMIARQWSRRDREILSEIPLGSSYKICFNLFDFNPKLNYIVKYRSSSIQSPEYTHATIEEMCFLCCPHCAHTSQE